MVFVEPSQTNGSSSFWNDERRNKYFLLQRHISSEAKFLTTPLHLVRSVIHGLAEYRIILTVEPYYQLAVANTSEEIVNDWDWIEESVLPIVEDLDKLEATLFLTRFFKDIAQGKEIELPCIKKKMQSSLPSTQRNDSDLLGFLKSDDESDKDEVTTEEENAESGLDLSGDSVEEVDLDHPDEGYAQDGMLLNSEVAVLSQQTEGTERQDARTNSDLWQGGKEEVLAGLPFLPEQYTHPEIAFNWLRFMSHPRAHDSWQFLEDKEGVYVSKREMEGTNVWAYRGAGIIDDSPENILDLVLKTEKWTEWDKSLESVKVVNRYDDHNQVLHFKFKKLFPSLSSLSAKLNMSSKFDIAQRDMVVLLTWGFYEGSYVVYLRSVEHDQVKEQKDVIRIETDGCGFLIEPMRNSLKENFGSHPHPPPSPPSASGSEGKPGRGRSGSYSSSMVTFVSNLNWNGWMPPFIADYLGVQQPLMISAIRQSLAPNLVFALAESSNNEDEHNNAGDNESTIDHALKFMKHFIEERTAKMNENETQESPNNAVTTTATSGLIGKLKGLVEIKSETGHGHAGERSTVSPHQNEKGLLDRLREMIENNSSSKENKSSEQEEKEENEKVTGASCSLASEVNEAENEGLVRVKWGDWESDVQNVDREEPTSSSSIWGESEGSLLQRLKGAWESGKQNTEKQSAEEGKEMVEMNSPLKPTEGFLQKWKGMWASNDTTQIEREKEGNQEEEEKIDNRVHQQDKSTEKEENGKQKEEGKVSSLWKNVRNTWTRK